MIINLIRITFPKPIVFDRLDIVYDLIYQATHRLLQTLGHHIRSRSTLRYKVSVFSRICSFLLIRLRGQLTLLELLRVHVNLLKLILMNSFQVLNLFILVFLLFCSDAKRLIAARGPLKLQFYRFV